MKLQLNSDLINIISAGQYDTALYPEKEVYEEDEENEQEIEYTQQDRKEWDEKIIEAYKKIISPLFNELASDYERPAILDNFNYWHPKEYNFATDEINFDLTIEEDRLITLFFHYFNDTNFIDYIQKEYKHYDGFISFMPQSKFEFFEACMKDKERAFAAIFNYNYKDQAEKLYETFIEEVIY